MWQIFTIGALVFEAAETAADKVIMVADRTLDTLVASFYRNAVFLILSLIIAATGIAGALHVRFEWLLLVVAVLEIMSSIFYTILLKRVEMTGAAAISYVTPFLFLLTDVFIIGAPLNSTQILGILLLISGGILFVIDHSTRRLQSQYTKYVLGILLFDAITSGAQYYVFKYYAAGQALNEISYMVSVWGWVAIGLLAIVMVSKKWRMLYPTAIHKRYLQKIIVSKSFDVGGALLWFHALTLATVSQVNAFNAFSPLILLFVLFMTQQVLKFKAGEDFTRTTLFQKTLATVILILGAWMAS